MLRNGMYYSHIMLPLSCHVKIFIRGTTFRHVLARVGDVHSLIPSSVHVMALTATATSSDRIAVTQMIGLQNPYTLKQTPSKPNIVYHIGSFKTVPLNNLLTDLGLRELHSLRQLFIAHHFQCVLTFIFS